MRRFGEILNLKKNFRLLNDFFKREATLEERQTFFDSTLPKMQKIVLSSKEYFHRPPQLLKKHSNKEIYLSQQQCGALLGKFYFSRMARPKDPNCVGLHFKFTLKNLKL